MKENIDKGGKYLIGVFGKKLIGLDMILELHKLRTVFLQDGCEITTEITRKHKEILEQLEIKRELVPTFLKR